MNSPLPDHALRRSLLAGGGAMLALGLFVITGRFTGHPEWTSLGLGEARMAFIAALCFTLAGGAFVGHALGRDRLAQVLGAITLALGLGTLLVYFLAIRVDWRPFMFDPLDMGKGVGFDGRMSVNAALAFAILGGSLLLMGGRPLRIRALSFCGAALLTVGALGMSNYLTGLSTFSLWWRLSGLAAPTGVALMLGGALLLLFVIRRADPAEKATAHSLPLFFVAGGLMIVAGSVNYLSNQQLLETSRQVVRAHEVRSAIDRLVAEVARMESSARGYALTGGAAFRKRVDDHREEIQLGVHQLGTLTQDLPDLVARIVRLHGLAEGKIAAAREMVRVRAEAGHIAAQEFLAQQPQTSGSALVNLADEIRAIETRSLLRHESDLQETRRASSLVQTTAGSVAFALVLLAFALEARASAARRRAERELRQLNEQLENRVRDRTVELERALRVVTERERSRQFLADAIPQLVWTTRADGSSESVNRRYCEFTGIAAEETNEDRWLAVLHPDDHDTTQRLWHAVQASGREGGGEYRMRRASDGMYRWMSWWARPERDAEGRLMRWVGTTTDIHDLKLATELLEQKVRERTEELGKTLALLRESRNQALEASRLKSEFLANMSHEIRTPMNGVIGMTELLLESRLTEDQRELATVVQRSAEGLLKIINDILDFSKIEAGKLQIDVENFELRPLIDSTLALFAPRAAAKGLRLEEQIDAALPRWVKGDSGRIRQVLTNLVGNAVKFTDRGEVRVVWCAAGSRVRCEVHDTGEGIAVEQQGKLFQAFVQVDGSTTRRHGGTGLGLAISRQLVELMGGEIGFTSEAGRGSVFWFELDLPSVASVGGAVERISVPAPAQPPARRLHFLVAEDSDTNRVVVRALLELIGHTCETAGGPAATRGRRLRCRADGLPDAAEGRIRHDARHPRRRRAGQGTHPDHRADGLRDAGGPRALPRRGHG